MLTTTLCLCPFSQMRNGGRFYQLIVNSTVWSSNFVACPNPSPEGQIFGAGGALFMDAAGSIVASGNLFQGNGVVSHRASTPAVARVVE